jgi:hypothetical protein
MVWLADQPAERRRNWSKLQNWCKYCSNKYVCIVGTTLQAALWQLSSATTSDLSDQSDGTEVGHEDCELLLLASNAPGKIAVNRTEQKAIAAVGTAKQ